MDTVLVTAFVRPEFLWLCLEHIVAANGYNDNHYIINLDYRFRRSNLDVIRKFSKHFNKLTILKTQNVDIPPVSKQSHAVLEGYRFAQQESTGLVYMIEEDVMIADHFFDWHKAIHRLEPDIYCAIGTRNNNTNVAPINDYSKYYLQRGDYQSLGVSFKKHKLNEVLAHANNKYYHDPFKYCKSNWPNSPIGAQFVEQDGLHRRVMGDQEVAFSYDGFAFHAGFYGYNRKGKFRVTGSISEKVAKIRDIAFNANKLKEMVAASEYGMHYYYDSEPVPLKTDWEGKLDKI